MKALAVTGKFYSFLSTLWDMIKLNFMWIIFSLPIITVGASTIAAFHVTLKMAENKEGHIISQFYQSFKLNFKQGVISGLIIIFVAYSLYMNIELFEKISGNPIIFLMIAIIIGFVGLTHFTYVFPLLARYDNSVLTTLSHSKEIVFKFFPRTIMLWVLIVFLILLFWFNFTLMFFGVLIGPASIFLLISGFAVKNFRDIEKENQSQ